MAVLPGIPTRILAVELSNAIIAAVVVATFAASATAETTYPTTFRVVWNYPDMACNSDLGLSKYGIMANSNRSRYKGDKVATVYSSKAGLWPRYDRGQPIHGGIPQRGNIAAHLLQFKEDIDRVIPVTATGYGVLDQELWRPLFVYNYASFRIYQKASLDEAKASHPDLDSDGIRKLAEREWEIRAREYMELSLQIAQEVRPRVRWGYYLFPQRWSSVDDTHFVNNQLSWLYKASSGIYPSIYLKHAFETSAEGMRNFIIDTLKEALRVRHRHSKPSVPILAYVLVENSRQHFNETLLDIAIGLAAEMGIDGVIIWGSSFFFRPKPREKCDSLQAYISTVLGPYALRLSERMDRCSDVKCGGQGRCVKKEFSHYFPHFRGMNSTAGANNCETGDRSTDQDSSENLAPDADFEDYECRCYNE